MARAAVSGVFVLALALGTAHASEPDSTGAETAAAPAGTPAEKPGLIYLVPDMQENRYAVTDDPERFMNRIAFSPGYGQLGSNELFSFRFSYSPNTWLGYEVALGHNPAASLHALMHTFSAQLRYPLPGRFQPYGTLGYGMMTVYPGRTINADPVTKNTLTYGGGLEVYLRNDVSLRGEIRGATVLGQQIRVDGTVAYDYREYTIGFAFYRKLDR
jgi:opacity protein-like surface antigen